MLPHHFPVGENAVANQGVDLPVDHRLNRVFSRFSARESDDVGLGIGGSDERFRGGIGQDP
jgi:hypothetical protein